MAPSHARSFSSGQFLAKLLAALLVCGFAATGAAQQIPARLDQSFNAGVAQVGRGRAAAVQSDGKILVGGTFTKAGGSARNGLARFNLDGSLDTGFQPGLAAPGGEATVRSVLVQGDGKILIGGNFTSAGGAACCGVARLNADGSLDADFNAGLTPAEADVRALLVQGDGDLLVGGYFTSIGGVARHGLARLAANGALEAAYHPQLYNSQRITAVTVMALQSDGKLFIGGDFNGIDGGGPSSLARLNVNGTVDRSFAGYVSSLYYDGVEAIVVQKDGNVLVGGQLNGSNGTGIEGLIRFKPDGTTDYGFRPDLHALGCDALDAMTLAANGQILLVSQAFGDVSARHRLLRLNGNGTPDAAFNLPVQTTGDVTDPEALVALPDGGVVYAGSFDRVNDALRDGVARINPDGSLNDRLQPAIELGGTGAVGALLAREDGSVVLGGSFDRVDGAARDGLARVRPDGTLDGGFAPRLASPSGSVSVGVLASQPDGKLLVGGNFTVVDGAAQRALVRFNADGTRDTAFAPPLRLRGNGTAVSVLVPLEDGGVLVGGLFDSVNGDPGHQGVVRLRADGTTDEGFAPSLDYYGFPIPVNGLAVQGDGKVLIGGEFTSAGNVPCTSLVRVNADGSLDATFQPVLTGPAFIVIQTLVLQPDGKVLVAGNFNYADGVACHGLARLNADGSLDAGFVPTLTSATGDATPVRALALQGNGRVLIAGNFDSVDGQPRPGLARLKADGRLDNGYVPDLGTSEAAATLGALALQADGKALVGGNFTGVDGVARAGVARLLPGTPPEVNLSVKAPGTAPKGGEPAKVTFKLTGDRSEDVTVFYAVKGKAQGGRDFAPLGGSVVIPAGVGKAKLKVVAIDDAAHEGTRHLSLKLLPSPSGGYNVGAAKKGEIAILDND